MSKQFYIPKETLLLFNTAGRKLHLINDEEKEREEFQPRKKTWIHLALEGSIRLWGPRPRVNR